METMGEPEKPKSQGRDINGDFAGINNLEHLILYQLVGAAASNETV